MKKLVLTLTALTLVSAGAFAQGKIRFVNDSVHLVYMTTDTARLASADAAVAGNVPGVNGSLPSGVTLLADLYAGTSSTSLSFVSSTTFSASSLGTFNGVNVTLPNGLGGGTPQWFQVQIRGSDIASASAASATNGFYFGFSSVFQTVPGSSLAYNSIVQSGTPALSTWAAGTRDVSNSYGAAGALGALSVSMNPVPEPTTLALAGLGIAAGFILRRRK